MDYFCFESVGYVENPIVVDFEKHEKDIAFCIGKSLSEFRKCLKKGQHEMADYFEVSVGQYRKYEAGIDMPKMHSAARWSALTGTPLPLLFKYTAYSKFFSKEELICREYFGFLSKSSNSEFYALLNLISGSAIFMKDLDKSNDDLDFELALEDVLNNYYYRVMKNVEAIKCYHKISRSEMSFLLGVSSNTYGRYVRNPDKISIPLVFYARAHAVLGVRSSWAETGTSFYSLINKRRRDRIVFLEKIMKNLSINEVADFLEMLCCIGRYYEKIKKINGFFNRDPVL
jgi:transcriptional regulator with XRE-family HTH domain